MIQIQKYEGQRVLELGGGKNRHPAADVNVDVRAGEGVDFTCNFEEPLPIQSDEFDAVYSHFSLEHVSWRGTQQFINEMFRVLKPGGKAIVAVPNTEEQIKWLESHGEGWDGKDVFESASCILYGDQDYPDNTHKAYWSPTIAFKLFTNAGFKDVVIEPYGERSTDMVILAEKPSDSKKANPVTPEATPAPAFPEKEYTREEMYDKYYFNGGGKVGGYSREGYWDYPVHEITVQHILNRKPESVLELGCARGYLVKRLNARHGIRSLGLEISDHCKATRVTEEIVFGDITNPAFWGEANNETYDLAFSIAFFEHVPEKDLFTVIQNMGKICKRGLHGIDFGRNDDGFDRTHVTLRPKEWWVAIMPPGHEVVDKEELEKGEFPKEVVQEDGMLKLNIGSNTQMFHHNWVNTDILDLKAFAAANSYKFNQFDLKTGIPYDTETVDFINMSHVLEHFTYKEALAILRDIRRVLKPSGIARIAVPHLRLLCATILEENSDFKDTFSALDALNMDSEEYYTGAMKAYHALTAHHLSGYDFETLAEMGKRAGLLASMHCFNEFSSPLMQKQCFDMYPDITLYAEFTPIVSGQ